MSTLGKGKYKTEKATEQKTVIHVPSTQEQEQQSKALVDANTQQHVFEDNQIINDMLTRASQFGELLDSDPTYEKDAEDIVKAKEIDDSKVVTFIKHIDRVLNNDQRALLPWPGSLLATEEAKRPKGSNQPLLFDKVMAAGRGKTFYNQMITSTKLGKEASADIERIQAELDRAKVEPDKARLPALIESDMRKAKARLNNLITALRTAAQVRLMIEDIKHRCPAIVIEWIRQEIPDSQAEKIDPDADLTMLNVEHAGDVVKSSVCLFIWTKPVNPQFLQQSMKKAKTYSVGSFKRWKVDKAIEIATAQGRSRVTVDDMIQAAKAKAPEKDDGSRGKTPSVSNVRDVHNWTELMDNADAMLNYWTGDDSKATARLAELKGNLVADNVPLETLDTMHQLHILLRSVFEGDPSIAQRAREAHEKLNAA